MRSDHALALYETHKHCPLATTLNDCTLLQRYFLLGMSVEDINYRRMLEAKLNGIAKGLGITFTENSTDKRNNDSFREKMKERQRKMKEKRGG